MCECEEMLTKLNNEFDKLMLIVRGDSEMLMEWRNRNRSGGAYQRQNNDSRRKITAIVAERNSNGSQTVR